MAAAARGPGPGAEPHTPAERVQEPRGRPADSPQPAPRLLWPLCPFLPQLHPPAHPDPLCAAADEVTVGKVYAALMIFDFYKQSKTSRDQAHQAPGGLTQVPARGFRTAPPVPSAVRWPWGPTPLPRRFGGRETTGPCSAQAQTARAWVPSVSPPPGQSCWGAPGVPGRERGGLRTARADATFLSGRAVGGDRSAGATGSCSPLTPAGPKRLH